MHVNLDSYHFFDSDYIATPTPVMLEVGAFNGDLAIEFLKHFPAGRVVIYEAESVNFASLSDSVGGDERIVLRHEAIAEHDGIAVVNHYTNHYSNSLFDRSCDGRVLVDQQEVRGVCLTAAMADHRIDYLDFLLLNCEGCELFALQQVADSPEIRNRIAQVCVSFHCLHSKMYPIARRDSLLVALSEWFDVRVGNATWEYYLLVSKECCR